MVALVTRADVKTGLRIDGSDDDDLLDILIPAASSLIIDYLDDKSSEILDLDQLTNSPPDATVPEYIQVATTVLVGIMKDGGYEDWEAGYLPKPVTALLYMKRVPSMA